MDILIKIVKRVSLSLGLLYGYNLLMSSFNIPLPINIVTIITTTILGIPGFIGLIVFYMINFM